MMRKILAVGVMFIVTGCYDACAVQYTLTDLGTLGGASSLARDINEAGQVVGETYDSNGMLCAFIWDDANGMINISGNNSAGAFAVNENGVVVGHYNTGSLPFRWSQSTGFEPLTTARVDYPTYSYGVAFGVSDSGIAVGHRGGDCPTYWDASGNAVRLSLYSGRQYAIAGDITDESHIIGAAYTYDANGTNHLPVYWTSTTSVAVFSMLAGSVEGNPHDLNDLNQTVGWNKDTQGIYHAVLWDTFTSAPTELGLGQALAISDDGSIILGVSIDNTPVLWYNDNGQWSDMYDLNDMLDTEGWTITGVAAINIDGYIAATASNGFEEHAVLLSPFDPQDQAVPEPITVISLSIACAALRFYKRK